MMVTDNRTWTAIATITSTGEEPNDINVLERTYLTVKDCNKGGDSKITIVRLVPNSWNEVRLRCIGITDNADVNFMVYSGTLANGTDCELVKIAKLEFKIGTQASTIATYEMADTVTVTKYTQVGSVSYVSPEAEYVAEVKWDLRGDDVLVIVPTAADCDAKLLAKGY
jgi:hypothetical protein